MSLRGDPIAVVIVNYNTREHLRECLRTVVADGATSVVVADNGSSDGSVEMVAAEFPSVVLDVDRSNPGYGAGANRGIRRCGNADVLLLNSDTRLAHGALEHFRQYLDENPSAGVIGPRLVYPDGSLQRSCFPFPTPTNQQFRSNGIGALAKGVAFWREDLASWAHDRSRVVPWVLGAVLMIRRDAFDAVAGFDESFFMYWEEIDLCYRMRLEGWETHFSPGTEVVHDSGASTKQVRAPMLAHYFASAMRFYRQHYSGPRLFLAEITMRGSMRLRSVRDRVRRALTQDEQRRQELTENLEVWRGTLPGGNHRGIV